jgi:TolA-binding protein
VRRYSRHQLKEDRFQEATADTLSWAVEHEKVLIIAVVAALLVVGVAVGAWFYLQKQDAAASYDLGQAIRTFDAPLRPAGMPADPQQQSFTSAAERAKAAQAQFQQVIQKYPHTRSADFAQYYLGLSDIALGDNAGAERELKEVAGAHDQDLGSLARMALAGFYRDTNRIDDAIRLYKELEAHPTNTVPKVRAQLDLASIYEAQQPLEAKKLYDQIVKDNPGSAAAQLAQQRLATAK